MQPKIMRRLFIFLVMSLLLVACQSRSNKPASVTVKTSEYAFEAPDQIEAGLVSVTLENTGQESHHVQFLRLNDDVTIGQFMAALQEGEGPALQLVGFTGGPAVVPAGGRQEVLLDLQSGQYVLACFLPDMNGVPHLAHGMIKPIQVVASQQDQVEEPTADLTISMKDFSIAIPDTVKAGKQIWKIVNEGPQPHEINLLRLAPGKTMEDVAAFFTTPDGLPPFEEVGGFQGIDMGKHGWAVLDLQPGNYLALCFIPDPASGKAHVDLGMVTPFTVQ